MGDVRGWDYLEDQMLVLLHSTRLCRQGQWLDSTRYEVLQFTEREDKSNKEIYDHDILRDMFGRILLVYDYRGAWAVSYKGDFFCTLSSIPGSAGYESEHIEVIGNIYENPELLK